jgi:hypothetical protein
LLLLTELVLSIVANVVAAVSKEAAQDGIHDYLDHRHPALKCHEADLGPHSEDDVAQEDFAKERVLIGLHDAVLSGLRDNSFILLLFEVSKGPLIDGVE